MVLMLLAAAVAAAAAAADDDGDDGELSLIGEVISSLFACRTHLLPLLLLLLLLFPSATPTSGCLKTLICGQSPCD